MKRIASIADMHCGHRAGLTPTQYLSPDPKWRDVEEDLWTRYLDLVKQFDTPDILIVNGDCIDGRGERSGGTELIAPSLATQRDMAVKCIMQWKAPKVVISRGTDYHTSWGGEDWEDLVAEKVLAETEKLYPNKEVTVVIKDHPFINVDGVTFDIKHHIGSSAVPYGSGTAIEKDKTWNEQWWMNDEGQPLADVIMRAHAHICHGSYGYRGSRRWDAIRLAALQAAGTKYGGRRCSRTVHWGIQYGDVDNERYRFDDFIARVKGNQVKAVKM